MVPPVSIIYFKEKKVIDKTKGKNRVFVILEDGEQVPLNKIKRIKIQCNECPSLKEIGLYHGIYEKFYICQSCNKRGERNSFFGKTHKINLKEKMSKERKGTWCVGEDNAMYGTSPKDYLTPEQLKIKAEKNRQDTLNREYNPFKYSMREILGDEKFEKSIKKRKKTIENYTIERKNEISKKLSEAQKKMMRADPEGYKEKKRRGGLASAQKTAKYTMNKLESAVNEWFVKNEIDVIYSAIMGSGDFSYQYDFKVKNKRILIECQGSYWHGDHRLFNNDGTNGKRKLNETQKKIMEKDKRKHRFAIDHDFTLLYIWEQDVLNNDFTSLNELLEIR